MTSQLTVNKIAGLTSGSGAHTVNIETGGSNRIVVTNTAITIPGTAAVTGAATVGGSLGVTGALTASDTLAVTNNLTVSKNLIVSANAAFTGTVTGDLGKMKQLVQGFKITGNAVTNTSYAASGLNVAITPSSASNKVLVICTWWAGYPSTNNGQTYTLYRGSTNLDQSSNRTGFNQIGSSVDNGNETYQGLAMSLHFLDSPSTTSATTYELYHKMDGGVGYFNMNQNGDTAANGQTCVITAMEVA